MAKRPTINTLTNTASPTYLTQLNQNFSNIQAQFDNTLSLDGSLPNAMNADLDLNDFDLINAGTVNADNLVVAGTNLNSVVAQAATSATNAATSASSAAASAATASQYTPAYFDNVTDLLADTRSWPTGQILNTREEGFAYEVVTSGQHVTTAGGVKLIVLPGDAGMNVKAFGAKGDGTTNDTTAIQGAIDSVFTLNGGALFFPNGVYKITASLNIPFSGGWKLQGESRLGVTLLQATNNTPIIRFTKENTNRWTIEDFNFEWAANQDIANTNAVAVFIDCDTATGAGVYHGVIQRVSWNKGCRGVSTSDVRSNYLWGTKVQDITHGLNMSGACIRIATISGGNPNNVIGNIYMRGGCRAGNADKPQGMFRFGHWGH